MAIGDHLLISFGAYQHHAIDLGDGRVIQYGGGDLKNNRVEIAALDNFPADRTVRVVQQPANFSPEQIVARANRRLGESNYDLWHNNCEHFVNWCRLGTANSRQVDRVVERVVACSAKWMASQPVKQASRRLASSAAIRAIRISSPWWLAADATQLSTEWIVTNRGHHPKQAQRAGRIAGAGASAGIGAVAAGPVGAAAGLGIWLVGELAGKIATSR